jgi:RNA polymerase sigma-70 factor (ECF subfamily)
VRRGVGLTAIEHELGDTEFAALAERYRRELLAHCYRMLGSLEDAEDVVQETLVRAWRGYARFEGRASPRAWLYRIATNVCLTALRQRPRRWLPSQRISASLDTDGEVAWIQLLPDAQVAPESEQPESAAVQRSSLRLAFVASLQS